MNYENLYIKNAHIAISINEARTDMRSTNKCVAIYLNDKIPVSIGINKSKTHPLLLKFNYHIAKYFSTENISILHKSKRPQYCIHAELDGYIKLLNSGADFNTLLIYRGNECDMASKPCHVCSQWLNRINKLKVCYIDYEGNFYVVDSDKLTGHHRKFSVNYKTYNFDTNSGLQKIKK